MCFLFFSFFLSLPASFYMKNDHSFFTCWSFDTTCDTFEHDGCTYDNGPRLCLFGVCLLSAPSTNTFWYITHPTFRLGEIRTIHSSCNTYTHALFLSPTLITRLFLHTPFVVRIGDSPSSSSFFHLHFNLFFFFLSLSHLQIWWCLQVTNLPVEHIFHERSYYYYHSRISYFLKDKNSAPTQILCITV